MGFAIAFWPMRYASGLFGSEIRHMQKDQQITTFRAIGLRVSPVRLRDVLLATYPDQPAEEHELAHLIGETAYSREGASGFRYCDSVFTFACYHGVILAAIRAQGYSTNVLVGLAKGCEEAGRNRTADIACAHGIGHGFMWVHNYNLLQSFQACDSVFEADHELRFFCWDGVSMENVVRRGATPQGMAKNPLDEKNMYAPCDALPDEYKPACVREHVFLVRLSLLGRDTDKTSQYCLHFPNRDIHVQCFGALGGALYQDDPSTPARIIAECTKVPEAYIYACIGVAARHYGFSRQGDTGKYICGALTPEMSSSCQKGVDDAVGSLYTVQTYSDSL